MLYHCPISELHQHVDAGSVDIILTDPPYPQEYLDTWDALGTFAEHALTQGGHLLAMSGHAWLPEVFASLSKTELRYQWTLEFRMEGQSSGCIGRRIFKSYWKPILWYCKGKNTAYPLLDMVHGGGRDKDYHVWGQPHTPFYELVNRISKIKQDDTVIQRRNLLVVDPFVGGGASAIAARNAGHRFIGADTDASCIEKTKERLAVHIPDLISRIGGYQ